MITRSQARWLAFAIVMLTHLAGLLLKIENLAHTSQAFIAPSLVPLLWPLRRHHTTRWTLAGLVFSFIGDIGPRLSPTSLDFFAMVIPFWIAQLCYLIAFAPLRRRSVLTRNPRSVVAYVAICVGGISWALPTAGKLWPIPLIYGVSILAMALLATGLGRSGMWGGVLFLFSDALIAVNTFLPDTASRATRFAIMLTYMLAQALLVHGVRQRVGALAEPGLPADTGAHS